LILYSRHAEDRLAERSIAKADVETAIRNPVQIVEARYGRLAAGIRLGSRRFLVVVYERRKEDFIVITAVKVNEEGARRFGFTRV
jgi:hypothetical protein